MSRAVNPKTVVDNISDLSLPATTFDTASGVTAPNSQYITVKFRAGYSGLLDMSLPRTKVWHEVIASMRQSNNPVYVEIDAETNIITELLIPLRVKVGNMVPSKENRKDVEVELIISQAVHHLRHTNPIFSKLKKQLNIAKQRGVEVLVTERPDDHEIIDVRNSSDSSDSDVAYTKSKDPSGKR